MPNQNYIKGRRKEYKICERLRKDGFHIVQRTAGSHSPIDVIAINTTTKEIKLVQAKPDDFGKRATDEILMRNSLLNGFFLVEFVVE